MWYYGLRRKILAVIFFFLLALVHLAGHCLKQILFKQVRNIVMLAVHHILQPVLLQNGQQAFIFL